MTGIGTVAPNTKQLHAHRSLPGSRSRSSHTNVQLRRSMIVAPLARTLIRRCALKPASLVRAIAVSAYTGFLVASKASQIGQGPQKQKRSLGQKQQHRPSGPAKGKSSGLSSWDPSPTSNPWGLGKIVAPAGKAPKGKRAGGTKQPVPGTPAAAKAWAYERRQMAATKSGVTIAVEGCCHGDLDKIYATLQAMEKAERRTIDLLICCGDFQAVRNKDDLECLACPPKYRDLKSFWRYYTGAAVAPFPTVFVGGNHEAANHLWELHNGGWVAPNIYYLGAAGVVNFAGIRIAGLSGIFNDRHYRQGHHERPPYSPGTMRSAYHIRELDVHRLAQLARPLDIFVSHDWPRGIAKFGDLPGLLRAKQFLKSEIADNSLGSPPGEMLLQELRPRYWFAAHLHVKFAAVVPHPPHLVGAAAHAQQRRSDTAKAADTSAKQQQALAAQRAQRLQPGQQPQIGGDSVSAPPLQRAAGGEAAAAVAGTSAGGTAAEEGGTSAGGQQQQQQQQRSGPRKHAKETRFLALDKCLPRRGFLQVVDFPDAQGPKQLCYDEEWLAVLRGTHHLLSLHPRPRPLPGMGGARNGASEADLAFVQSALAARGGTVIPDNFVRTAKAYDPKDPAMQRGRMPQSSPRNPQSEALLQLIGVPYNLDPPDELLPGPPPGLMPGAAAAAAANPEEIDLDGGADDAANPEEIDLDDVDEGVDDPEEIALDEVPCDDESPAAVAPDNTATAEVVNPEEIDLPE
mmetsp:Transcript_4438/g.12800  ORF Transcript_4438/g.12800 Transcript_4438/m.12800 type:complete len:740 (-) Transcript_4438:2240-4459(-)